MSIWGIIGKAIAEWSVSEATKRSLDTLKKMRFAPLRLFPKKAYYYKVTETLKNMPFIYKDLETSEVLKDFQDVMVFPVERSLSKANDFDHLIMDWSVQDASKGKCLYETRMFKDHHKILILGSPGIGKSTLMRHATLIAITKPKEAYFPNAKNYLPIFVSLNVVSSAERSPIVNYILTEIEYFKGRFGKKRFQRLLSEKGVLLILDGYDEINHSELTTNYARSEMSLFFSTAINNDDLRKANVDPAYHEMYRNLAGCPVWLSTRREFYDRLPLSTFDTPDKLLAYGNSSDRAFAALQLTGLNTRREAFVKKIFSKFQNKGARFETLNAELFIKEIDRKDDEEIKDLSRIPLFLTIMCYLHIKELEGSYQKVDTSVDLTESLVVNCIDALLWEIDNYKAETMRKSDRLAFLDRRSSMIREKKEFLNYFALCLFSENKIGFTEAYIKDKATTYLSKMSQSVNKRDLVRQLLESEIFNTISVGSVNKVYDFRHRRFREVLAKKYIVEQAGLQELLEELLNPNLSEFLSFLYSSIPGFRDEIISKTLDSLPSKHFLYANDLLFSFLEKAGTTYNLAILLQQKLKLWILEDLPVRITKKNTSYCTFDDPFLGWLKKNIIENDQYSNRMNSLAMAYALLKQAQYLLIEGIVREKLKTDYHGSFPAMAILNAHYFMSLAKPKEYLNLCAALSEIPATDANTIICKITYLKDETSSPYDPNWDLLRKDLNQYLHEEKALRSKLIVLALTRKFCPIIFNSETKDFTFLHFFMAQFFLIGTIGYEDRKASTLYSNFQKSYQQPPIKFPSGSGTMLSWEDLYFHTQFDRYEEMDEGEHEKLKSEIQLVKDETFEFLKIGII